MGDVLGELCGWASFQGMEAEWERGKFGGVVHWVSCYIFIYYYSRIEGLAHRLQFARWCYTLMRVFFLDAHGVLIVYCGWHTANVQGLEGRALTEEPHDRRGRV